ncbi:MAG: four helix bundle protein [Deltaproteobacteria bacterium]|nr:four helix bundle protein [Deltaproteobacteria bacterium]
MLQNYTCHGVADKRSRKELKVWQKSYELCLAIYRMKAKFPNEERYGLTSQIIR